MYDAVFSSSSSYLLRSHNKMLEEKKYCDFSGGTKTAIFIICNSHKNYTRFTAFILFYFKMFSSSLFAARLLSLNILFYCGVFVFSEWKILIESSFLFVKNMKENIHWIFVSFFYEEWIEEALASFTSFLIKTQFSVTFDFYFSKFSFDPKEKIHWVSIRTL